MTTRFGCLQRWHSTPCSLLFLRFLMALNIAGLVIGSSRAETELMARFRYVVNPESAEYVLSLLNTFSAQLQEKNLSIIAILGAIITATGVFVELRSSLNEIWGYPRATQWIHVRNMVESGFLYLRSRNRDSSSGSGGFKCRIFYGEHVFPKSALDAILNYGGFACSHSIWNDTDTAYSNLQIDSGSRGPVDSCCAGFNCYIFFIFDRETIYRLVYRFVSFKINLWSSRIVISSASLGLLFGLRFLFWSRAYKSLRHAPRIEDKTNNCPTIINAGLFSPC